MGVYIKGMEMPKNIGVSVTIYPDGRVIRYLGYGAKEQLGTAVSVPPHGRLKDADALTFEDDYYGWRDKKVVKAAPTIIPAEEGE